MADGRKEEMRELIDIFLTSARVGAMRFGGKTASEGLLRRFEVLPRTIGGIASVCGAEPCIYRALR